ncbi:hypothetical protein [Kribbella sp. NPDC048915]|uniref:hypothetical protein n=1 Tax=Kribbella sp. NPDC048915 TaxID=3155148 RepID=UPI0033C380AA
MAVTRDSGAWLMPTEPMKDTAIVWDPPHRCVSREQEGDWFNQVEFAIEGDAEGSYVRYVHSGIFDDDWDNQHDGASKHTKFYMHSLGEYLRWFRGLPYRHTEVSAPPVSALAAGLDAIRNHFAMDSSTAVGTSIQLPTALAHFGPATLDYHDAYFIGLRTSDALIRVFGRNHFGAPVGVGIYQYGDHDTSIDEVSKEWSRWLDGVYGGAA